MIHLVIYKLLHCEFFKIGQWLMWITTMDIVQTQAIVLEALHRASSQDADVLKPAEAKLKEWETRPGFYTVLFVNMFSYY